MELETVGKQIIQRGLKLAVMESCTGGLLAYEIVSTPGSGDFFLGGVVSYATEIKERMGVDAAVIDKYGVVSAETAASMAAAVRDLMGADIGIGITGVAGPATQDGVPVGKVFIALNDGQSRPLECDFGECEPEEIQRNAVDQALALLARVLGFEKAAPTPPVA